MSGIFIWGLIISFLLCVLVNVAAFFAEKVFKKKIEKAAKNND